MILFTEREAIFDKNEFSEKKAKVRLLAKPMPGRGIKSDFDFVSIDFAAGFRQ